MKYMSTFNQVLYTLLSPVLVLNNEGLLYLSAYYKQSSSLLEISGLACLCQKHRRTPPGLDYQWFPFKATIIHPRSMDVKV